MRLPVLLACAALSCLTSCVNMVTPPGITVASTPPGARVAVDGRDSGFVTPCNIALDQDDHWIELSLDGYAKTTLFLEEGSRWTYVPWSEGVVVRRSWAFPLFLPAAGLLAPIEIDRSPSPSRIHVELRLSAVE